MSINLILLGAVTMAGFTISLFFLRFWRTTQDRFFLFFAISFFIEGATRITLVLSNYADEYEPLFYLARLVAFLMILLAIVDKNWVRRP